MKRPNPKAKFFIVCLLTVAFLTVMGEGQICHCAQATSGNAHKVQADAGASCHGHEAKPSTPAQESQACCPHCRLEAADVSPSSLALFMVPGTSRGSSDELFSKPDSSTKVAQALTPLGARRLPVFHSLLIASIGPPVFLLDSSLLI